MPVPTRFLTLIAGAVIALARTLGIAHSASAAVHAASASGIGWDGVSAVTGSPSPTVQAADGIGWD